MKVIKTLTISIAVFFCASFTGYSQHIDQQFRPLISARPDLRAVATQADGKIIVAGDIALVDDRPVSRLIRLNADGTLDESFTVPDFIDEAGVINSILVDNEQRIIIGGDLGNGTYAVRLLPDGTHDKSFSLGPEIETVIKIDAFPGNRYIVLSFNFNYPQRLVVVRSDGRIDPSFNAAGPNAAGITGNDLTVLPDGRILYVGSFTEFNGVAKKYVARLNADGSIDDTFNAGEGPEGTTIVMSGVKVQSDGKILIAGRFTGFNNFNAVNIVRLHPDGAVDESFVMPGPAANFFDSGIRAMQIVNDHIYLAGLKRNITTQQHQYSVWKLDPGGALNKGFSAPLFDLSETSSISNPWLLNTDDGIYLTGAFFTTGTEMRHGIARLDKATGDLDPGFAPLLRGLAQIQAVRTDEQGRILVGGLFDFVNGVRVNNLARLNAEGALDETFAFNVGDGPNNIVNCIEIDSQGRILIAGAQTTFDGEASGNLVRLTSDGTVDDTFTSSISSGINALRLLPDQIVIGGNFTFVNEQTCNGIAVLEEDGSLAAAFSSPLSNVQRVFAVAVIQGDKLIVGGHHITADRGILYKIDADGNIEEDFHELDFSNRSIRKITSLSDGGFLASGTFARLFSDTEPNAVWQFNSEGKMVDNVSIAVYAGGHRVEDMMVLPENRVLLAGSFKKINTVPSSGLSVIKLNGDLNSAYNFDIRGVTYSLYQQGEGSTLLVAGVFSEINGIPALSLARIDMDIPATPTGLVYDVDNADGEILLSWTNHAVNEAGFQVLREVDGVTTIIDTVDANVQTYADLTAAPMKTYRYTIRAISDEELSSSSNAAEVSTTDWVSPVTPENVAYNISENSGSVELSWTDKSDNEQGFEIERALGHQDFSLMVQTERNVTSVADAFAYNTRNRYRVRAYNKFGRSEFANIVELPVIVDVFEPSAVSTSVYPNPAGDVLYINHASQLPVKVTLQDLTGKVFIHQQFDDETITLDLNGIPSGLYVISMQTATGLEISKVYKR